MATPRSEEDSKIKLLSFLWVRCGKSSSWRFESTGNHQRSQTTSFFWELGSQSFEIVSYVANRIWKSSEPIV